MIKEDTVYNGEKINLKYAITSQKMIEYDLIKSEAYKSSDLIERKLMENFYSLIFGNIEYIVLDKSEEFIGYFSNQLDIIRNMTNNIDIKLLVNNSNLIHSYSIFGGSQSFAFYDKNNKQSFMGAEVYNTNWYPKNNVISFLNDDIKYMKTYEDTFFTRNYDQVFDYEFLYQMPIFKTYKYVFKDDEEEYKKYIRDRRTEKIKSIL